ncbi:VOC family protein [Pseudomonas sp. App30]|uniref:VOC family protein n=1 Tax=Pseudomonas sp. App30 TaxID=3068990 RepID=UPI003A808D38
MAVKAIPDGQHSITAYLALDGAAKAIAFYQKAFGATEVFRLEAPGGRVGHAELRIGDCALMLADTCDQGPLGPIAGEHKAPVGLHLYVEDADAVFAQALAAGATQVYEVKDQFYGDRSGTLRDPFGNVWFVATHKEDLTPEQIHQRAAAMFGQGPA